MKILDARAPSRSEPGTDVGMSFPVRDMADVMWATEKAVLAIQRRDPQVCRADICYEILPSSEPRNIGPQR